MAAGWDHDEPELQAVHAARETLATSRTRLHRYRAALEKGADPGTVSQWFAEVQDEKIAADAVLRRYGA